MRVAYIDCVGGASGDMLLGALVDAGASEEIVRSIPAALQLSDCAINFQRVMRGAAGGLKEEETSPRSVIADGRKKAGAVCRAPSAGALGLTASPSGAKAPRS